MRSWRWHAVVVTLLALAAYGQLLVPGDTLYSPHSDFVAWGLGNKEVQHRSFLAGHGIPFWRADQLAGYAAFSNPNSLYTYPLHAPFWFMPPQAAVGPVAWLHFLLSALAFYALGAALGLAPAARLAMAVAGLFNFKLILATYAGFLFMPSAALVPGLFAAFLFVWRRGDRTSWLAFTAMAYLCLHGHPQIALYAAVILGGWSLVWALVSLRGGNAAVAARAGLVLGTGSLVALGLCAHFLLPLVDELPLVTRGERSYEGHLAGHSVGVRHLATLVAPEALGTPIDHSYPTDELWEDVMYFGVVPLLFGVLAPWLRHRRAITWACAATLLLALLLACDSPFLRLVFDHVPGASFLRHPGRILFLAPVFGIALGGIGLDAVLERTRSARHALWLVALVVCAMGAEGTVYARRYVTTRRVEEVLPAPPYLAALAPESASYRVLPIGRATFNYGWAATYGLQLVTGYDHIHYRHFQVYMDVLRQGVAGPSRAAGWYDVTAVARPDLLSALNVRYAIAQTEVRGASVRLREVGRWPRVPAFFFFFGLHDRPAFLYENMDVRGRAFFPERVAYVDDRSELAALAGADVTRVALVHDSARSTRPPEEQRGAAQVESVRGRDGYLDLVVHADAPRYLVISEIWHPGWRASLDGRPLALFRTDVALMGAWVPTGRHRLVLAFEPVRWPVGLGVSALAFATWSFVLLSRRRRK